MVMSTAGREAKMESSLVAQYNNLLQSLLMCGENVESKFVEFVECEESEISRVKKLEAEVLHLQGQVVKSQNEIKNLEIKLKNARLLLEREKLEKNIIEREKGDLAGQIGLVMDLLGKGHVNETREKLQQLQHSFSHGPDTRRSMKEIPLTTITEDADTLGSVLSISSIDLTEDDLEDEDIEESQLRSGHKYKRKSSPTRLEDQPSRKRLSRKSDELPSRRSGEDVKLHEVKTQVTTYYRTSDEKVNKFTTEVEVKPPVPHLQVTEENYYSDRENRFRSSSRPPLPSTPHIPQQSAYSPRMLGNPLTPQGFNTPSNTPHTPMIRNFSASKVNTRSHSFQNKTVYKTEHCQPCAKRIRFGKVALKCRDCRAICHPECRESIPLPCIPVATTPNAKGQQGSIADYVPDVRPMVPAIVVHCCNEVENRGLNEIGIYRVPGSDREVRELKERFLRGKGMPNLSQIDINVICGCFKNFMRSLKEPLVAPILWHDFVSAAEKADEDASAALYQAISELPPPNRDTMAWIILHLQRVAECTACKMPISNLSKVFGPTLVGYSVPDPQPAVMAMELSKQLKVVEKLLEISSDYWNTIIDVPEENIYSKNIINGGILGDLPTDNKRRRSILSRTPLRVRDTPKSRNQGRL